MGTPSTYGQSVTTRKTSEIQNFLDHSPNLRAVQCVLPTDLEVDVPLYINHWVTFTGNPTTATRIKISQDVPFCTIGPNAVVEFHDIDFSAMSLHRNNLINVLGHAKFINCTFLLPYVANKTTSSTRLFAAIMVGEQGHCSILRSSIEGGEIGVWTSGQSQLSIVNTKVESTSIAVLASGCASVECYASLFRGNNTGILVSQQAGSNWDRCSFSHNYLGAHMVGDACAAIRNCTFQANAHTGIWTGARATTNIQQSAFTSHQSYAIVFSDESTGSVRHCKLQGDRESEILLRRSAHATIADNTFTQNLAHTEAC